MAYTYFILLLAVTLYAANATIASSDDTGFVHVRPRRGIQVFEHIIKQANFMFKTSFGGKVYRRKGGLVQARTDFCAMGPDDVRDLMIGSGKVGTVGDKIVQLHIPDRHLSSPSLSIQSKRGNFPDVMVIYKD